MNNILKTHRVIGIRHALRQLKDAGLVDEDTQYPEDAIVDVQGEVLSVARAWYKTGAKRGALEVLEAFLNGTFEVVVSPDGSKKILANEDNINWNRALRVKVGNDTQRIKGQEYKITIKTLGFE